MGAMKNELIKIQEQGIYESEYEITINFLIGELGNVMSDMLELGMEPSELIVAINDRFNRVMHND